MADNSFLLRVVSGRGVEVEVTTRSVSAPSPLGQLGFLPDHCDYVGLLGTGIVEYETADGSPGKTLLLSEGMITFKKNVLTLLADSVEGLDSIDRATFAAEKEALEVKRSTLDTFQPEWAEVARKLERIVALDTYFSAQR
jgi:F0F1-type ATP synthase epsilon subunit